MEEKLNLFMEEVGYKLVEAFPSKKINKVQAGHLKYSYDQLTIEIVPGGLGAYSQYFIFFVT